MKYFYFLILMPLVFACASGGASEEVNTKKVQPELYEYDIEEKLREMEIVLKEPAKPVANYVHAVRAGNLVFMAGKGPVSPEGERITGKLGQDLTVEQGYEAAKYVAISQLAALKAEIGDLNKVKRVVKVLGMVNATSDFENHPEVINGFSDFMVEVFGERGKHARAAVGMGSLPRNIAVEIEMIVELQEE